MNAKEFIQLPNGEKLAYVKYGSGEKNLILLHGNYASSWQYLPLLENLPADYTAYAIDLRGYGDSSYYRRISCLKDFSDDVKHFVDILSIKRFSVIGWSLGGGVAMQLTADLKEQVDNLILISSTTYKGYPLYKKDDNGIMKFGETYNSADELIDDNYEVKPILEILKKNDFDAMKAHLLKYLYINGSKDNTYVDLMTTEALKQRNLIDADFALASFNMGSKHNFYTAGNHDINNIKCPVLHIIGVNDELTPKYLSLDNYYALKNNSEYIEFSYCGHSLLVNYLTKTVDSIYDFLERNNTCVL